jgi:hypothetical protein
MKLFVPILAAVMALATACNSDSTSPTVSIAGTWSLRTLNGQSLPVQTGPSTVVSSEQLTLNNDGTYNDVVNFTNGTFANEFGYYTVNNNQITFVDQSDNNFQYTGSISGNVLTTFSGITAVYQKS